MLWTCDGNVIVCVTMIFAYYFRSILLRAAAHLCRSTMPFRLFSRLDFGRCSHRSTTENLSRSVLFRLTQTHSQAHTKRCERETTPFTSVSCAARPKRVQLVFHLYRMVHQYTLTRTEWRAYTFCVAPATFVPFAMQDRTEFYACDAKDADSENSLRFNAVTEARFDASTLSVYERNIQWILVGERSPRFVSNSVVYNTHVRNIRHWVECSRFCSRH